MADSPDSLVHYVEVCMFLVAIALQDAQDSGSTISHMIHSIPHDAAAALIYVLMAGFVGLIIAGSRKKKS
jgi:hypothetical protein